MNKAGIKKEEYREMKPYWHKRLMRKRYNVIIFRNGYATTSPTVSVELKELLSGLGIIEWGAPENQEVYILRLGDILSAEPTQGLGDNKGGNIGNNNGTN